MKVVYTLKQHPQTNEYHLFEAKPTSSSECIPERKSMCKAMDTIKGFKFACANEQKAFLKCAELGRQVCGNCMKELYGTNWVLLIYFNNINLKKPGPSVRLLSEAICTAKSDKKVVYTSIKATVNAIEKVRNIIFNSDVISFLTFPPLLLCSSKDNKI